MKIKEFDFMILQQIEAAIIKWIVIRKYRVLFFIVLITLLLVFSNAPYINLFFNSYFIVLFAVLSAPFVLDINPKIFFITALILFVMASLIWFVDKEYAEKLGNYMFIVLFSGMLKTYISSLKE